MTDIVIPLSKQSTSDNLELRLALRSIQKYAKNTGNIWIYTEAQLPWLRNAHIIRQGDPITNNKDANLINKILAASRNPDINERFMFWSDDQVLTAQLDLDNAPIVMNCRGFDYFQRPSGNKWYTRMKNTMQFIKDNTGQYLNYNYDSHVPQPYTKSEASIFEEVPYMRLPGFCINTIYYGMLRKPFTKTQDEVKVTFEGNNSGMIPSRLKTYIGYDTTCWQNGIGYFLTGYFFTPSKYQSQSISNS